MIALEPGLMDEMDDGHFLAALECESSLMRTPVELSLMRRLDAAIDELAEYKSAQVSTRNKLESLLEELTK